MNDINLEQEGVIDNIKFMIKYCDSFLDYCHDENLSIDGNIVGEIIDAITEIERYLEEPIDNLEEEDLKIIYEYLNNIYDSLLELNDIKLFNTIHIVYSKILLETKEILEKKVKIEV